MTLLGGGLLYIFFYNDKRVTVCHSCGQSALSLPDWSANLFFSFMLLNWSQFFKTAILYKAHRVLQIPLA